MDEVMDGKPLTAKPTKLNDNLYIWPCNLVMGTVLLKLYQFMGKEKWLKFTIDELMKDFNVDYILIDCAPSLMVDLQNALVAADELLIVAKPDKFSALGIVSLLSQYEQIKKYLEKPDLKVAGILLNMVDMRNNYTKYMVANIREQFKELHVFNTMISSTIKVSESLLLDEYIGFSAPEHCVAKEYKNFVDEFLVGQFDPDYSGSINAEEIYEFLLSVQEEPKAEYYGSKTIVLGFEEKLFPKSVNYDERREYVIKALEYVVSHNINLDEN